MMLNRLDNYNGVVHHQADGEHESKSERIDCKTEHREKRESAD